MDTSTKIPQRPISSPQSPPPGRDESNRTWFANVKDAVTNFIPHMENPRQTKDSATPRTFRPILNWPRRFLGNNNIKKDTKEEKLSFPQEAMKNERKLKDMTEEFENTIELVGIENSKKKIVDELVNGDKTNASVRLFIIMGAMKIGKTELARLVYKDEKVKAYFQSPKWIEANSFEADPIVPEIDEKGEPFLVVLNDLKFENDREIPEKLKPLTGGNAKGAIVITTGHYYFPDIDNYKSYIFQGLNEEESWCLFKENCASSNMNEEVEREIVRLYGGGVPMKIKAVAELCREKSSVPEAELGCAESSVPEEELCCAEPSVPEAEFKQKFLEKIRESYYQELSPFQKELFQYFSLFPQEYEIEAERLIHLWMADTSLLSAQNGDRDFCVGHFNYFVPFVLEKGDEFAVLMKRYKMNRLMLELARTVGGHQNIMVDSSGIRGKLPENGVIRASFDFTLDIHCEIPKILATKANRVKTILLLGKTHKSMLTHDVKVITSTCDKIFTTFKSLEVLALHDLGINTLPRSIGEVSQLTYLDLSHNNIEKLPNSIINLVQLQTLKLSQCHVLRELPKIPSSLVHLYLDGCLDLTHMPPGIGQMTSLQTLSLFVASKKYSMGDLKDLNNLTGFLEIRVLEQLQLPTTADCLKEKEHLHGLTLRWDLDEEGKGDDVHGEDEDKKILDSLQPNQNLKVLSVVGYNGRKFSDWLPSIEYLVRFSLNDCPNCRFLPSLDRLQHLRILELRRLDALEAISENTDHNSADNEDNSSSSTSKRTPFFPSLEELTISDCPKLRSWWKNEKPENGRPFFTSICRLDIQFCPTLACMPLYPYLSEELILVDSSVQPMRDTIHAEEFLVDSSVKPMRDTIHAEEFLPFSKLKAMQIARIPLSPSKKWLEKFTSLEKLQIRDCSKLTSLPQGFGCLSSLQCLSIEKCPVLDLEKSEPEWEGLKHLRSLTLREISKLNSLPSGVGNITSLQEIGLYECPSLTSLPESIGNLTSLTKLVISECINLPSLPEGLNKLQNLKKLIIIDCPLLLPRCQPETGDDWAKIPRVTNVVLKKSSQESRDPWIQGRACSRNF